VLEYRQGLPRDGGVCSRIQSRRASASSHLTPLHFWLSGDQCSVQSFRVRYTYTYTTLMRLYRSLTRKKRIRYVTKLRFPPAARVALFGCAAAAGSISRPLTPSTTDRARAARDGPCSHTHPPRRAGSRPGNTGAAFAAVFA
jgi:hypothetical protein